jgi:hypothetical protein
VEQTPGLVARLQAWQSPVQAWSQQTLSAQCPEAQSSSLVHTPPLVPALLVLRGISID